MKKSSITFSYNEDKLTAIRVHLMEKNLDLEKEMCSVLDTLYKKHVPVSVRNFIELKDVVAYSNKKRPLKVIPPEAQEKRR